MPAPAPPDLTTPRPCPTCGYDLRATPNGQCPECGAPIPSHLTRLDPLPWPRRRALGTPRAWLGTFARAFRYPHRLWEEADAPVDDDDARAFQRTCMLPVALLAAVLGYIATTRGWLTLEIPFRGSMYERTHTAWDEFDRLPRWTWDWVGHAMLGRRPIGIALALAVFAWGIPAAMQAGFAVIREDGHLTERARRAAALTRYTAAPFLLLLLTLSTLDYAAIQSHYDFTDLSSRQYLQTWIALSFGIPLALWFTWAWLGTWVRLAIWSGAGIARLVFALAIDIASVLAWAITCAFVFAWLPGFARLAWYVFTA